MTESMVSLGSWFRVHGLGYNDNVLDTAPPLSESCL